MATQESTVSRLFVPSGIRALSSVHTRGGKSSSWIQAVAQ